MKSEIAMIVRLSWTAHMNNQSVFYKGMAKTENTVHVAWISVQPNVILMKY